MADLIKDVFWLIPLYKHPRFDGVLIAVSLLGNELPHDKTKKMTVHPAKTQISLGICPVWSIFTVRSIGS